MGQTYWGLYKQCLILGRGKLDVLEDGEPEVGDEESGAAVELSIVRASDGSARELNTPDAHRFFKQAHQAVLLY